MARSAYHVHRYSGTRCQTRAFYSHYEGSFGTPEVNIPHLLFVFDFSQSILFLRRSDRVSLDAVVYLRPASPTNEVLPRQVSSMVKSLCGEADLSKMVVVRTWNRSRSFQDSDSESSEDEEDANWDGATIVNYPGSDEASDPDLMILKSAILDLF